MPGNANPPCGDHFISDGVSAITPGVVVCATATILINAPLTDSPIHNLRPTFIVVSHPNAPCGPGLEGRARHLAVIQLDEPRTATCMLPTFKQVYILRSLSGSPLQPRYAAFAAHPLEWPVPFAS